MDIHTGVKIFNGFILHRRRTHRSALFAPALLQSTFIKEDRKIYEIVKPYLFSEITCFSGSDQINL